MKKIISILLIVLCLFSFVACKEDKKPVNDEPEKISSFIGTWQEIFDKNRETEWYEIVITENSITIYDCSTPFNNPNRKSIWEGSYSDPKEPVVEYSYDSKQVECTDLDNWYEPNTRTFTYKDGILSVKKLSLGERNPSTQPYIQCKKLEETN